LKNKDGSEVRHEFNASNPIEIELYKELSNKHSGIPSKYTAKQLLSLVESYLTHLKTEGKLSAQVSCSRTFDLWKQHFEDIEISQLTQGKLGEFKRILETLISRKSGELISAKTITTHIKNVVAFSYWASANYDGISALSSRGVTPKRRLKEHEQRQAFTDHHLKILFGLGFDSLTAEQQWLMRLGALTGARIEEICQLSLDKEIRVSKKGTYYFSFNESDPDKSIKSISSIRDIPIHPRLIELGLFDFWKNQMSLGLKHPFESLWGAWRGKWGKYPGKWFSKYKASILIEDHSKLTFHSFRHSISDQFKKMSVDEQRAAAIIGHKTGGITYNRYAKPFSVDELHETMSAINGILIK
jgi:integrase